MDAAHAHIDVDSPSRLEPTIATPPATTAERRRHRRWANFFVGFRIVNPEIIANITRLQQRIATQFPELERCLVDARTLHVTLCTLHLACEEDIQQATRILEEHAHVGNVPPFGEDAPAFDFHGLAFFRNNYLLYCPMDVASSRHAKTFEQLARTLHGAFDAAQLTTNPWGEPFTPHITVWKTTHHLKHMNKLNKHRTTPIEVALGDYLKQSDSEHFGTEWPTTIELLSAQEKEVDGYYRAHTRAPLVYIASPSKEEKGYATEIEVSTS